MKRTFAHRVSAVVVAFTAILAGVALYCFLQRQGAYTLCGLLAMAVAVLAVERTVHTEYVLTDDGVLHVVRGRFARSIDIPVAEMTSIQPRHTLLHLVRYVLIEYGSGHAVAVQPADEAHFISEIKKIQQRYDENETIQSGGSPDDDGSAGNGSAH